MSAWNLTSKMKDRTISSYHFTPTKIKICVSAGILCTACHSPVRSDGRNACHTDSKSKCFWNYRVHSKLDKGILICIMTGVVSNSMTKWTNQECAHILSYRTVMKIYFLLKLCTRKRHWSCDKTLSLLQLLLVIWIFSKEYYNEFSWSGRNVLCFQWGWWGVGSKIKEVHVPGFPVLQHALWQPVGWFQSKALTSPVEITSKWFLWSMRMLIFVIIFSALSVRF